MTSRERLMKALNHEEPDRVPIDLGGNQTGIHKFAYTALIEHLGIQDELTIMDAGTAVYEKSFTLPAPANGKPYVLELGKVGVIATVRLNGKEVGTVWTAPWQIDISDHIRAGRNDLQISVANTWNNRLVADASLPKDKRLSYVSESYRFDKKAPLISGGLIGPVRVGSIQ